MRDNIGSINSQEYSRTMKLQLNEVVRAAQSGIYPSDIQYDDEGYVNFYYLSSDGGNLSPYQYTTADVQSS